MVGLSVVLESYREERGPQILSKGAMIKPSSPSTTTTATPPKLSSASGFLEFCFLCNHKLMPARDIYMYKGDKAFCSEDCRYRQIFMDEEESGSGCTTCSLAATSTPRAPANAFAY